MQKLYNYSESFKIKTVDMNWLQINYRKNWNIIEKTFHIIHCKFAIIGKLIYILIYTLYVNNLQIKGNK